MARTKNSRPRRFAPGTPPSSRERMTALKKETVPSIVTSLDNSPVAVETSIEPIPATINTASSLPKRSIRAASEAITKREQEKKRANDDISPVSSPLPSTAKKPALKKKRKLNTKKVVMVPSSTSSPDELGLENTSVDSYSKYLNPKEGRVAPIVIDIKKRKMVQRNNVDAGPSTITAPTHNQFDSLDLSHHSIIPNASYVAHISLKRRLSATSTVNGDSDESSILSVKYDSSDEYFDALSEFEDEIMEGLSQ
ncbi:hypothetical protein HPULCUR_004966 [Helicostylum pulchrum]|uniref:Uncharacterized protein n=1 Tax=Helicostylum pulchrum TaxID=562976 RepID=A0ABP9XZ20_9FUNG